MVDSYNQNPIHQICLLLCIAIGICTAQTVTLHTLHPQHYKPWSPTVFDCLHTASEQRVHGVEVAGAWNFISQSNHNCPCLSFCGEEHC